MENFEISDNYVHYPVLPGEVELFTNTTYSEFLRVHQVTVDWSKREQERFRGKATKYYLNNTN